MHFRSGRFPRTWIATFRGLDIQMHIDAYWAAHQVLRGRQASVGQQQDPKGIRGDDISRHGSTTGLPRSGRLRDAQQVSDSVIELILRVPLILVCVDVIVPAREAIARFYVDFALARSLVRRHVEWRKETEEKRAYVAKCPGGVLRGYCVEFDGSRL
jgi:hypothetical protein